MAQEKDDAAKKKVRRPQAEKRQIQSEKRKLLNRSFRARVGTAIRNFEGAVTSKNGDAAKANLNAVYSLMDKGVKTGVFKLNKASRTKARLSSKIA